jgi:hypothetical protein
MANYIRIRVDETGQMLYIEALDPTTDKVVNTMGKFPLNHRNVVVELDMGTQAAP